uniref:Uncharacterized protein n=1 Tax=Anguilla anguilla TaxID=7936 RepID=A0A0E9RRR8_ANGAN
MQHAHLWWHCHQNFKPGFVQCCVQWLHHVSKSSSHTRKHLHQIFKKTLFHPLVF